MNDYIFDGDQAESVVLRTALEAYKRHTEIRRDPEFVPAAGKRDRSLYIIETVPKILERLPDPGRFSLRLDEYEAKLVKQAINLYLNKAYMAEAMDERLVLRNQGLQPPPQNLEATVERRPRWT